MIIDDNKYWDAQYEHVKNGHPVPLWAGQSLEEQNQVLREIIGRMAVELEDVKHRTDMLCD